MTSQGLEDGLSKLTALTSLTLVRQSALSAYLRVAACRGCGLELAFLSEQLLGQIDGPETSPPCASASQVDVSGLRNASIGTLAQAAPQLQSLALIKCPWLTNSCVQHFNGFR